MNCHLQLGRLVNGEKDHGIELNTMSIIKMYLFNK